MCRTVPERAYVSLHANPTDPLREDDHLFCLFCCFVFFLPGVAYSCQRLILIKSAFRTYMSFVCVIRGEQKGIIITTLS